MASSKTAYLEQVIADFLLGNTSYTPPATYYIALSTGAMDASTTGSTISGEPTTGGYSRQPIANNTTNFPAGTGSLPYVKNNALGVDFGTASADWGTIQSVYVCDAASGGNALWGADLAAPVPVSSGSGIAFPAGTLIWDET